MTNSPDDFSLLGHRVKLPGIAVLLFIAGPVLLVVGLVLASGAANTDIDFMQLGTVLFWIGAGGIIIAVILEGVRSIADQQVHILLKSQE